MSRNWRIYNQQGLHFISFATVGWIDVFARLIYKDIIIESLSYCQKEKGLELYAWCIMTNHIHIIARAKEGYELSNILRDLKRHTSKAILQAIKDNPQESRKEWMLSIFKNAGSYNSNNTNYQFWRQDNKPIELKTPETIMIKLKYIHNNPIEQQITEKPEEYIYSSAKNYAGEKGLLDVILI